MRSIHTSRKSLGIIYNVVEPVLNVAKGQVGKEELCQIWNIQNSRMNWQEGNSKCVCWFQEAEARIFSTRMGLWKQKPCSSDDSSYKYAGRNDCSGSGNWARPMWMQFLPILMTSEISSKLPARFMNVELAGSPELGNHKNNVRRLEICPYSASCPYEICKDNKWLEGVISEVDELFRQAPQLDPGMLSCCGREQWRVKQWKSCPNQHLLRTICARESFSTGVYIAKTSYPGLPDAGVLTFARILWTELSETTLQVRDLLHFRELLESLWDFFKPIW